jgi:hypothetical protein
MKSKHFLIALAMAAAVFAQTKTSTLQQGLDGYGGCVDRELRNPETNYFSGPKDDSLLVSEH